MSGIIAHTRGDPISTDVASQTSQRVRLDSARGRWIIAAMALGSGMIFLDSTVVNVALPKIQSDLTASLSGLQWIINAYTLLLAALLLIGGSLGDVYGRKKAFIAGLLIFTLASVACGLAPNLGVLIAARAVQGIGGALLVPCSLAIITAVIDEGDTGRAIGMWAGLSGVTTALGPLLGGYLVDAVTWRAIFFINVPLAAVTLYALVAHVPANRDDEATRDLDWPAALAIIAGLGGMTYGLIQGPTGGWSSFQVLIAFVIGIAGLALFPIRELFAAHPMVPLSAFRSRNFSGANLATIGVYFSLSGAFLFLILDLQQVQGYSALAAGASLLPVTILMLFLSPRIGALTGRFGARGLMTTGAFVVAGGCLLLAIGGRNVSYGVNVFPGVVVIGLGLSVFVTPLTVTVMSSVPGHLAGVASGVSNTLTRIASLLAIAILGVVILARFDSSLSHSLQTAHLSSAARVTLLRHDSQLAADPLPSGLSAAQRNSVRIAIGDSYIAGFRWAMYVCAALCASSGVLALATIRTERRTQVSS
ncbi:MAG: MFS transporter [Chloroflexota bacterium]